MARNETTRDPVPQEFSTLEEAANFWDTHDLTDYEDIWTEVEIQVQLDPSRLNIRLDPQVAQKIVVQAEQQHVSPDVFVNQVLKEYLEKQAA